MAVEDLDAHMAEMHGDDEEMSADMPQDTEEQI